MVGYNSLVNKDVPPKTLVGGMPIKVIKKLK
jgi:acetyltransferase-like isoleucine patch superfamily enzyme